MYSKAKVNRTLISTVMSSLLYQLSYNPFNRVLLHNTDKGFAPLFTGHEPIMLLLHQSAIYSLRGVRTLECNDENIMS
jgi:hypothetical protein